MVSKCGEVANFRVQATKNIGFGKKYGRNRLPVKCPGPEFEERWLHRMPAIEVRGSRAIKGFIFQKPG